MEAVAKKHKITSMLSAFELDKKNINRRGYWSLYREAVETTTEIMIFRPQQWEIESKKAFENFKFRLVMMERKNSESHQEKGKNCEERNFSKYCKNNKSYTSYNNKWYTAQWVKRRMTAQNNRRRERRRKKTVAKKICA